MAIVTREQVKTFLSIDTADRDALIDALIPEIEADYLRIRNRPFDVDANDDPIYPDGSQLTAALMVGYHLDAAKTARGMQSESLGDYSYTRAEQLSDYPAHITRRITRFVGVK